MLLKFFKETRAYTSIFLCLVLLPMVTYSAMIIDASRLQSARVQAQSAGDLAINAAMSEYEQVLEDMYGLFANATSPEQMRPVIQQYFEETISGNLVNPEGGLVQKMASELTDYTINGGKTTDSDKEYTNFLQMRIPEATDEKQSFLFEPVPTSSISNPAVMKGQIIDYMKYRGPVSIGQNFLNKLGFLKDMKNQSEAVQGKVEVAQKIADINKKNGNGKTPMEEAYSQINNYNDYTEKYNSIRNNPFDKEMLKENLDDMSKLSILEVSIQKLQLGIPRTEDVIKEMLETNTDGLMEIQDDGTTIKLSDKWQEWYDISYTYTEDSQVITETVSNEEEDEETEEDEEAEDDEKSDEETEEETKTFKVITINLDSDKAQASDKLKNKITALQTKRGTIDTAKNNLSTDDVNSYKTYFNTQKSGIEFLKGDVGDLAKYTLYINKFKEYFDNLNFSEYENNFSSQYSEIEIKRTSSTVELKFLESIDVNVDEYVKKFKEYAILNDLKKCMDANDYTLEYSMLRNSTGGTANYAEAEKYYFEQAILESGFKTYCDIVTNIVKSLDEANVQLTLIKTRADTAKNTADSKIKSINTGENKVEDDTARSQMISDIETLSKSIDPAEVEKLNKVVKGYLTRFQEILEKLNGMKYFDVTLIDYVGIINEDARKIKNETKFSEFKNKIKFTEKVNKVEEVDKKDADSLWNEILTDNRHKGYEFLNDDSFKSKITTEAVKITGIPEEEVFYNVLKNTIEAKDNKPEQSSTQQQNLNDIKDLSDVKGEGEEAGQPPSNAASKLKEEGKETSEPAKAKEDGYHAGTQEDFDKAVANVKPNEKDGYGKAGKVSVPDEDTNSDKANDKAKEGKKQLAKANELLGLIAKLGNGLKDDIYLEEYFTEMFTCQTDALKKQGELTLLNGYSTNPNKTKYINMKNEWYGSEMEYILWGKPDLKANLTTTETTIFLLRFVINSVYAFTASDIQSMASSIATALVGWSVILVPVVQVCITLAVALAESALDLSMLKDGKDVPLLKDSATFICSPKGAINKAIDYGIEKGTEFASDKVSEGIDKLADKAKKRASDTTAQINQIVNDYVEQQTDSLTSAVRDNFASPLISTIHPILSKLNGANIDSVVDKIIDDAWTNIGTNIENMENKSLKNIASAIHTDKAKAALIKVIKEKIPTDKVPSPSEIEDAIRNTVNGWIDGVKDTIDNEVKQGAASLKSSLDNAVKDTIENGADSLKEKANEAIEEAGNEISGKAQDLVKEHTKNSDAVNTKSKSIAAKITMNYKEYCKLFIFIGLVGNQEDVMMQRAAVLMEMNIKYAVKGDKNTGTITNRTPSSGENFDITKAYTMFYVQADMEMGTLFPWAVKVETDGTNTEANLDLSHLGENSVNLRYSGMAGY